MKNALLLIGVILYATIPGIGQGQYPFNAEDNTSSISAYWYNCKPDSVTIASLNETAYFHSSLQIYGPCISDSFSVEVEVFLSDNSLAYSNRFPVKKGLLDKGYQIDMKNRYFRIMSSVDLLNG